MSGIMRIEAERLAVVKAVQDRNGGHIRNPCNEFECGSKSVRLMATYTSLQACSGFYSEMARGYLIFEPLKDKLARCFFWSVDAALGEIEITAEHTTLSIVAAVCRCAPSSSRQRRRIV